MVIYIYIFFLVGGSCAKECVQQLASRRCFCMVTRDRSLRVTGAGGVQGKLTGFPVLWMVWT